MPVTAATGLMIVGSGHLIDVSETPDDYRGANIYLGSTTSFNLAYPSFAQGEFRYDVYHFTAGLAVGDIISITFGYEAASDA